MRQAIDNTIQRLQAKNYKAFYLSLLRVMMCVLLLKDVAINWSSMHLIYGKDSFVVINGTVIDRLPGGYAFVRDHYGWIISLYIGVIVLYIFGIGRWVTAFVLFCMLYFVQKMNVSATNNGDVMGLLIVFYLAFADSYRYFALHSTKSGTSTRQPLINLVSNLAALSIMIQLCVAYLGSFLAKINDPLWFHGQATYYALSMERFMGTSLNQYLVQHKWFCYASNYGVLALEMLFPILIWIKRFRKPLLLAGILMHAGIYVFMMIYGFQVAFVMIYGFFLPNEWWLRIYQKGSNILIRKAERKFL